MASIWVYLEKGNAGLSKASLEVLGEARRQADALSAQVSAVMLGEGLTEAADQAGRSGADRLFLSDSGDFADQNPEALLPALISLLEGADADYLFLPVNVRCRELSARLSAQFGSGLAADVTAISAEEGQLKFTRPIYAGKALETVSLEGKPAIATLRPNLFSAAEEDASRDCGREDVPAGSVADLRSLVKEAVAGAMDKVSLQEATVIVSGGRGMKEGENFSLLEDLATTLGAAVGASRAAVDSGWRDHAEQVGQTGKTVSPVLYIACGISGAIQHLAGMSSSRTIVAINKDPEAPIFKVADYGIVGDLFEVVPLLTEEFRKVLS
ncbi:MAG: electron transfer flavoprotein subunit alpha/FixB family protein [Candidatus Krumholzibacteria bacterium]|nr:electron transfer flavoprotein subunit alpha/FixB family protein [Candidatus Krumholzibacteria bacterium]MDP6670153.1 electron transfer flavoprotein subunit alpha/FixB family protein [Candidatus Krumholzibacteria bacterium]MDP6797758.1 electron transfer flavoprotein subunit alpha/FixB family protein [Candidatus Krumholzibacteria bacterium]MDP7020998.1 electron transfer flavoprotein subunit alpha/FixB family protein [Candidatus Krumholzibacteria bacterium]